MIFSMSDLDPLEWSTYYSTEFRHMPTHELMAALDSDCSIIIISYNLKKLFMQLLPVPVKYAL